MTERYDVMADRDRDDLFFIRDRVKEIPFSNTVKDREICEAYTGVLNEVENLRPLEHWRLAVAELRNAQTHLRLALFHLSKARVLIRVEGYRCAMLDLWRAIRRTIKLLDSNATYIRIGLNDRLGHRYSSLMASRKWWVRVAGWKRILADFEAAVAERRVESEEEYQRKYPERPIAGP